MPRASVGTRLLDTAVHPPVQMVALADGRAAHPVSAAVARAGGRALLLRQSYSSSTTLLPCTYTTYNPELG
eukprot:747964-Hanusia_phi.AAC.3